MKKPVCIPVDEDAAVHRLGSTTGAALENSVSSSSSAPRSGAEKSTPGGRNGSDNGDEQPREGGQESVVVERRGGFSVSCKWTIAQFSKVKARALWSKYFQVGGFDCRLLVYPRGDSQALPGYLSIYLQVTDPRGSSSSKWDCFASYRLSVVNQRDESKSLQRDSWHRFSMKKKSHGWCDFTPWATLLDPKSGFLVNDSVLISTEILVLNETGTFTRENEMESLSGKFTWKVHNFSLFREMIKTQKIMSPVFSAGDCNLRLSVYQSVVTGVDHLSMCLESKETEKTVTPSERSCWCLFRMTVLNQKSGSSHMHRDSYGRFAGDNKSGDNTSLGWNDYMKMEDFMAPDAGYIFDDSACFSATFHVIKESCSFTKPSGRAARKSDGYQGKFVWKIENFTKLKDLLKKRKITGLCIKSRRFQVGSRDCRLIVYPRGQSQPPCHLSMFLEVTDPRNASSDWSCFVSHRLCVVHQREERSVVKESQNRYCKAAKDWGWREFITLTNLFDQDSGFLVQDAVTFSAEVLILKETTTMLELPDAENRCIPVKVSNRGTFTWKVENFLAFKEIMETRKIFSKFFQVGGCELRIGVYESFDTLCIYLESDQSPGSDPDRNFWVRYRMAVTNQKYPDRTVWKDSSICTKTWNNSVLQFMKVSDMVEPDAGFLMRDSIVFVCEVLDCCPWFEFSDLEVFVSDDEQDALSTDPDDLLESDDSDINSTDEEDIFRSLLSRAGFHLNYNDNPQLLLDPSQLQVTLREKLLMDAGAVAAFLTGLRVYLDDPAKVKRLLMPTRISVSANSAKLSNGKLEATSPSLMNLFMGVKVLQQAIVDLLLDIMVECCQPAETKKGSNEKFVTSSESGLADSSDLDSRETHAAVLNEEDPTQRFFTQRLESAADSFGCSQAVQSCDSGGNEKQTLAENEVRWPEQSEELLNLIVKSLRAVDGAVPHGCPEPPRRPQSAQKMTVVLENAPKYLHKELLALVPRLVDQLEHYLVADALLKWLQKNNVDASLLMESYNSLVQLEVTEEGALSILQHAISALPTMRGDSLPVMMSYIFKAAAKCQGLPVAIKAVRTRLKGLGFTFTSPVLHVVRSGIHNFPEAGGALLKDIDSDCECSDTDVSSVFGDPGKLLQCGAIQFWRIADVDFLVEMLSIPSLRSDAQRVFERAIARGAFREDSLVMVLENRRSERLLRCGNSGDQGCPLEEADEFSAILGLAEGLSRSKGVRVQEFVSTTYAVIFKVYADGGYRERMLRGLVEQATSSSSSIHEIQLGMDILTLLVREDVGTVARPVLSLIREACQTVNAERASILEQLRAVGEELTKVRNDKQAEIGRLAKEKASLTQRVSEAETAQARTKSDLRLEIDRLARAKRETVERLRDAENQLEWSRAERDEETTRHASEKKSLQDRLRDAENQLAQLKARKRDELKKAAKEKNAMAERLKSFETARKRYEDELKRCAGESASREELIQSQQDQLRRLKEALDQSEMVCGAKEQDIIKYEAYLQDANSKLQSYQNYVQRLQLSLDKEVIRLNHLYGVGLETMTPIELDSLAKIHVDGLRLISDVQRAREEERHGLGAFAYPAVSLGSASMHGNNGRLNGTVNSLFSSTS